jgi:hypothetical protein
MNYHFQTFQMTIAPRPWQDEFFFGLIDNQPTMQNRTKYCSLKGFCYMTCFVNFVIAETRDQARRVHCIVNLLKTR